MRSIGINEIAEHLNISRNTVSKVMNNRGRVAEKTKIKIVETAIKLGYDKLPKDLETAYAEKKSAKNILVIATSPDFSSFWGKIINGITKELAEGTYQCFYHFLTFEQATHFTLPDIIKIGDIAGIIIMNLYNLDAIKSIADEGIPTVYYDLPLGIDVRDAKADVVVVEGRNGVFNLTTHLIEQGDTKLGFIGDASYCKSIEERWRGFIRAHEAYHLPILKEYCFTNEENGHFYVGERLESTIQEFLNAKKTLPDGFVCANDAIAYKVMNKLQEYGYRIPEDIRITGFDDIEIIGEKNLTSIGIEISEIGGRLAQQLVWRIEHPNKNYEMTKMYGEIYMRKSSQKY
ncbi:MAG: LacI family DNA-binding transcriptional regulator [Niameybacter sp.]